MIISHKWTFLTDGRFSLMDVSHWIIIIAVYIFYILVIRMFAGIN
jgi:hypothetical protein